MIGKRNGNKDNGDLSGPPPESPERKKPRKSRKSDGSLVTISQSEIDKLNGKLAASAAQIELYQFQIRNLRADLDHIKLHSVLTNLGGPIVISEDRPEPKREPPRPFAKKRKAPQCEEHTYEPHDNAPAGRDLEQLIEWYEPRAGHSQTPVEEPEQETEIREEVEQIEREPVKTEISQEADADEETAAIEKPATEPRIGSPEEPEVPPVTHFNIHGIKQNFSACIETINNLSRKLEEDAATIKNRDTLIELQRERIELEKQKAETEFVPIGQYETLHAQADELRARIAAIETEIAEKGDTETDVQNSLEKLERLESTLQEIAFRNDALQSEKEEASATHEAEINKLKNRIQTLNDERAKSESEIIERLEQENETLRNEKEAVTLGLAEVRKGRDAEIDSLWRNIEALKSEQAAAVDETINNMTRQSQELLNKNADLEKRLEEAARFSSDEIERLKRIAEELRIEKESAERQSEERMKFHSERLEEEFAELREAMQARENELVRQEKLIEELESEVAALNKENFNIRSMLEATRVKVVEVSEKDTGSGKKRLLEKFAADHSPATLLELRSLFLSSKKYDDAVRTFRKLLIEPGNQKFMPAVCLLVGEFYNLSGRKEEGSFYLANPLIKDDIFARQLISSIQAQRQDDR